MSEQDGARPAINPKRVGPAAMPQIKSAGMIGFGTDNNNQDSDKRPKPVGSAPDSHVCTYPGKPSV
jgi:hypothetical protein